VRSIPEGISATKAIKIAPFSKYRYKDLKAILEELEQAELLTAEMDTTGRGRPSQKWTASG